MDSLTPEIPLAEVPAAPVAETPALRPPRVWKFWGTLLWGLFVFAAMSLGQISIVVWLAWRHGGPFMAAVADVVGGGLAISLSVLMGLPAVLAALWIAIRPTRTPFADYLGLRGTSWVHFLIGGVALAIVVAGWDQLARATGHEVDPMFMGDMLKSAQSGGALWLLVIAVCIGAPISEELLARGFLYRGWSESFLRPTGAIVLSSLLWTAPHLQYDLFFLGEVFSIGLLFGYLRYRTRSTWLTITLHCLNNLAAMLQTIYLAS
jgi:membrane protease YdiL (CAAX protease family)